MIHLSLAYIVTRKNTRKRNAKVQQPCISLCCIKYFLLAEACFNVYRFVAATYFSTIVFVCVNLVVK